MMLNYGMVRSNLLDTQLRADLKVENPPNNRNSTEEIDVQALLKQVSDANAIDARV